MLAKNRRNEQAAPNKTDRRAMFYTIVPIDSRNATPYVGPHRKMCGREFASRGYLANSKLFNARAWIISGLQLRGNTVRRDQVVFDLSALAAGEFHPPPSAVRQRAGSV
jgi:hypothetical protein